MMKKVLILTASARKGGNSERLALEFAQGAAEVGNEVETLRLFDHTIEFCRGCLVCQKTQQCIIRDDANAITQKMLHADVLVFATPVYYYSVSGQLKTMLDRANPLYSSDYAFRDVYLLASAAENAPTAVEGTQKAVQGWVDCFGNARLAGVVFAGGVNEVGEISGHPALQKAYKAGRNV